MATEIPLNRPQQTGHLIYGFIRPFAQQIDEIIPSDIYSLCILFHGLLLGKDSNLEPILQLLDIVFDDWKPTSLDIIDFYIDILNEADDDNANKEKGEISQILSKRYNRQSPSSQGESQISNQFRLAMNLFDSLINPLQIAINEGHGGEKGETD